MFLGDVVEADSVQGFVTEQAMEMAFRYFGESIRNTVTAFIWPVYVIQFQPPWGPIALGAAFLVFPRYVKPRLERFLFGEEVQDSE